jgi:uncharacterized protein YecE (DUF72 family)
VLTSHRLARVAADPELAPGAGKPGSFDQLVYYRLHGSPRVYYSEYTLEQIADYAKRLKQDAARGADVWCIFDNTALGTATTNALLLMNALAAERTG